MDSVMIDYDNCPFCQKKFKSIERFGCFAITPKVCENSDCNSQFTVWRNGDYYFLQSRLDRDKSSTKFVIESSPEKGLTKIRIIFNPSPLIEIDKTYNPSDPEELDRLLKIVDRLCNNLSLR